MYERSYDIVRNRAGMIDQSADGRIKVGGDAVEELMNYLVGSSVYDLPEGRMTNTLMVDENGLLISIIWLVRFDDHFLIVCDEQDLQCTLEHVQKYSADSDCSVEDTTSQTFDFGLMGPNAEPIVAEIFNDEICTVAFQSWMEMDGLNFVRYGSCGEYEIHVIGPVSSKEAVEKRLKAEVSEGMLKSVEREILPVLPTEMRHLRRSTHVPEGVSVVQAGIQQMIDFSKHDFCGKAAIVSQRLSSGS